MKEFSNFFLWLVDSAKEALEKVEIAEYQTSEGKRKTTIINVKHDEALVIKTALEEYIKKHQEG